MTNDSAALFGMIGAGKPVCPDIKNSKNSVQRKLYLNCRHLSLPAFGGMASRRSRLSKSTETVILLRYGAD